MAKIFGRFVEDLDNDGLDKPIIFEVFQPRNTSNTLKQICQIQNFETIMHTSATTALNAFSPFALKRLDTSMYLKTAM